MSLLIGIPVKPFTIAKKRLSSVLDAESRGRLGKAIAAHTVEVAAVTGADIVVVTGDDAVRAWATAHGFSLLDEPPGGGLDGAAAAVAAATHDEWLVLHADLPLLTAPTIATLVGLDGPAIAPSRDGGTNAIKGYGDFRFAYGPGSFHRHLRAMPEATVVTTPELAIDLDTPRDLAVARRTVPWLAASETGTA